MLQKFFGMIRSHCGSHDHPNALIFIQIYRLLSVHALIKPPKRTNVGTHGESITKMLIRLKNTKSITDKNNDEKRTEIHLMIDEVIDAGVEFSSLIEILDVPDAIHYFAGHVARKAVKFTDCHLCVQSLVSSKEENVDSLIAVRDKFNVLIYPSEALAQLAVIVESVILDEVANGLMTNTALKILINLSEKKLPILGRSAHSHILQL